MASSVNMTHGLITPPPSPRRLSGLTEHNVTIGSIVMLNEKPFDVKNPHRCVLHDDCQTPVIRDGAYRHPAAVLQIWDERNQGRELMAAIAIISGSYNPTKADITVPIYQGEASFIRVSEAMVYLEPNSTFRKQSYIQISHIFAVPFSMLRPLAGRERVFNNRLCEKSYNALISALKLAPQFWIPTQKMGNGDYAPFTSTRFEMVRPDLPPFTIKPINKEEANKRTIGGPSMLKPAKVVPSAAIAACA